MKKDNFSEYSKEAFRYYAACRNAPEAQQTAEDGAQADMEAVRRTIHALREYGDEAEKALRMVYLCADKPRRGDIQSRVRRASMEIPMCEKSVYKYLALARLTFARERGLRTEG